MSDSASLIQLEGVSRVLGAGEEDVRVEALREVSLHIGEGEFVCVTGPSGSGKSTLMNILGCLDRPDSGSYRLAGREVGKLGADALAWLRRRMFGFVFQNYNLLESVPALENVELPGRYAGMSAKVRRTRARELLDRLGLSDRAGHLPRELSGGEQQRVAIARALMNGGRIILADEPTGALDRANGEEVLSALEDLAAQGHTVVITSHDREIAARARRRIELRDGRVIADTGQARGSAQRLGDLPQAGVRGLGLAGGIRDTVAAGLSALRGGAWRGSRVRTLLPVLSVLVGVWFGALPFGVGEGVYQNAMDEINENGLDTVGVIVNPFQAEEGYGDFKGLTRLDAKNIERLPNVRGVSPVRKQGRMVVRRDDIVAEVHVVGMVDLGTKEGRGPSGYQIDMGDFITLQEDANREQVVVLGSVAREKLFPSGDNPIGEQISIRNVPFRVKGVLKRRTNIGIDDPGQNEERYRKIEEASNDFVHIPYRTGAALLFGDDRLSFIFVFVDDVEEVENTARAIKDLGIRLHGSDVYYPDYPQMHLEGARAQGKRLLVSMGLISGAALLAGNLSVIATMLMSVRARRREIGLRMAVGARRSDILRQFFGEALILSVLGGLAGVLVACASIPALWFFEAPASFAPWHFVLPFACAIAVAVPFAAIPARRASRMNPVAALSES